MAQLASELAALPKGEPGTSHIVQRVRNGKATLHRTVTKGTRVHVQGEGSKHYDNDSDALIALYRQTIG
jgi:hypothetical protein